MNEQATHILLVEDEKAHVELVCRAFEAQRGRFHLSVAGSLAEARARLAEALPHLIIADLRLPDGLGTGLLPADGEERTVPLVVMTAQGDEAAAVEAMKAGALDYLVKSEEVLADMPRIAERALREWRYITERQVAEQALRRFSQENAVMAEIGRIVNSSLDIEEVYERIGSQVGKLVHFDRLTINIINRENGTAASTFVTGIDIPELPTGRVFPLVGSSSGLAVSTKATQLILPQHEQELAELFPPMVTAYRAGIKSFMLVPLISQGEVVAVMRLQSKEANAYSEDDVRVAELVGAQVAGAIANAQLFAERMQAEAAERRRSQELAGLYEISRIFSAMGDFEAKATDALEKLVVLASADWVTLRLPKEGEPGLRLVAASGPAVAEYAPIPVFTKAMTMSMAAFAEGRIIVIDDYASQPAASQILVDLGMQSMVILPVKTGDRTMGVVTVISKDKNHFSPELVELLTAVGEGLGVLLENSMLHEESETAHRAQRRMAEVNSAMAEISRIISSSLDIDEVYEAFAAELAKLVTFKWASVNLVDLDEQTLTATYVSGEPVARRRHGETFPLAGTFTGAVINEPAGLVVDFSHGEDHTRFPGLDPFLEAGYCSFMGVRLIHHDRVMGVLILAAASPGAYGDRDLEIAARAARQIAGAIANASLYVRQREADEEIRDLAKFPSEDPNPVIRMSDDGIIMYVNDAATKILENRGLKDGESTLVVWQELVKEALASGTAKEVEIEYGPRIISYSLVPVPDAGYANIYGRDITAAKEVERMKDEFISTVSHELRTPLTSIKGAAEILLNYQDEDPAVQAEFLNIIDNESDRLTRLINDVLDLARMESGQMQFHTSEVDLPGIIETAVDSTHSLTVKKDLTIEIALDEDLPTVASDPDRLVQVLTNLLSNAIKFTPRGGLIRVRSRLLPIPGADTGIKMVEVSVSDNGVGIPDSEFEKIFKRFQQVSTTLSDRPQGTGLGLPISKEIVEHLGGAIWVESEPGKGSTFFFTIPLEQSPEQSPEPAAGEPGKQDNTALPA
ncbi:MAG: GAF domain-containing protein [Chloroflexi bacterium]|nr:GAF domain-containing protein [Chloroflexota bacterium]